MQTSQETQRSLHPSFTSVWLKDKQPPHYLLQIFVVQTLCESFPESQLQFVEAQL